MLLNAEAGVEGPAKTACSPIRVKTLKRKLLDFQKDLDMAFDLEEPK